MRTGRRLRRRLDLLDAFLERAADVPAGIACGDCRDESLNGEEKKEQTILEHFRLLQACDNLSLLTCVAYDAPAHLLHPLPLKDGTTAEVKVEALAPRHFRLDPWPFAEAELSFTFPARHVEEKLFADSGTLEKAFQAAPVERLAVKLSK